MWLLLWAPLAAIATAAAADPGAPAVEGSRAEASASAGAADVQESPEDRERRRQLTERADQRRPTEQLSIPLFGRPLTIGGEYELHFNFEGDPSLGEKEDDRARLRQEAQLELFYPATEKIAVFLEGKYDYRSDLYREDGREDGHGRLRRGETWIHAADLGGSGFGLQLGRQNIRDRREWWWDEDLDAVRLLYDRKHFDAEVAFAQEVAPRATDEDFIDPEQDGVRRLFANASWRYRRPHWLKFFLLHQWDESATEPEDLVVDVDREDEVDGDLTWIGLRANGRRRVGSHGKLTYWADAAVVHGDETVVDYDDVGSGRSVVDGVAARDVLGWGLDGGLSWSTRWPGRPSLTIAYAFGSGDGDPESGTDHSFRQTGLQDNDGKFRGVNRFRYYGELLDPELSNLHIGTLAVGFPLLRLSSVELLYHYYHQVHASEFLRDSRLRTQPEGRKRSLGHGFDAVVGLEEWKRVRVELVGSIFRSGPAFGDRRDEIAYRTMAKIEFVF